MAACALCILGLTEEEHTPERWQDITREEIAIITGPRENWPSRKESKK